jgi:uncharacterized integral membrane protein
METIEKPGNQLAKIIIGIIVIALVVVFSLQNSDATRVRFIVWEGNAPLVLLFLLCFVIGLSFSILAVWPINKQSKRKSRLINELNARIEVLETQLKDKQF